MESHRQAYRDGYLFTISCSSIVRRRSPVALLRRLLKDRQLDRFVQVVSACTARSVTAALLNFDHVTAFMHPALQLAYPKSRYPTGSWYHFSLSHKQASIEANCNARLPLQPLTPFVALHISKQS